MQLKVINSNSSGNCYLLFNEKETLIIEAGVRFDRIKEALDFNMSKVVGAIITHEHRDHCKAVPDLLKAGINVYASPGTHKAMETIQHHRAKLLVPGMEEKIGGFKVKGFDVKHDCEQPMGFLITHPETGLILFLTDSYYVGYTFPGLNNVIIEANYCQMILKEKVAAGASPHFLRDRVFQSHMSIATCKKTLQANDLSQVQNIVLIHLSDGNSDAKRFKREVEEQTGKVIHVAEPGLSIPFNLMPF